MGKKIYHHNIRRIKTYILISYINYQETGYDTLRIWGVDVEEWGPSVGTCINCPL